MPLTGLLRVSKMALQRQQLALAPTMVLVTWERLERKEELVSLVFGGLKVAQLGAIIA